MNRVETAAYRPQGYPEYYQPLDRRARQRRLGETAIASSKMIIAASAIGLSGAAIFGGGQYAKSYQFAHEFGPDPVRDQQIEAVASTYLDINTEVTCHDLLSRRTYGEVRKVGESITDHYRTVKIIHLDNNICATLEPLAASTEFQNLTADQVNAMGIVMHEQLHVEGVDDEPAAECFGIQRTAGELIKKGYTRDGLEGIQDRFDQRVQELDTLYRSDKCVVGGEFDLSGKTDKPASNIWISNPRVPHK